jgi:hypothetical protein
LDDEVLSDDPTRVGAPAKTDFVSIAVSVGVGRPNAGVVEDWRRAAGGVDPARAFFPVAEFDSVLVDTDELEPAEPAASANATAGIDAIAAPTPSATANAPTRPT